MGGLDFADVMLRKLDDEIKTVHNHLVSGHIPTMDVYQKLRGKCEGLQLARDTVTKILQDN